LEGERIIRLSPEAAMALLAWETEVEGMLSDGGSLEVMRDWGAKLVGATLRLAAVMHCVEHGPAASIGGPIFATAVSIARYLVSHAEAVLHMLEAKDESCDNDAHYVLRWIERHGRREFTKSEAQHHGKRRFPKADDIDPALAELAQRGYVRLRSAKPTGPGRRPSPTYEVNPSVFGDMGEKRSCNSRNAVGTTDGDNSGNIGNALASAPRRLSTAAMVHETSTTDLTRQGFGVVGGGDAAPAQPDADTTKFPFGFNNASDPDGERLFPESCGLPD
jgi:hypothetical protein